MIKFALIRESPQIFSLGCPRLSGNIVSIPGDVWLARVRVSRRGPVNGQESVGVTGSRGTISLLTLLSTCKIYIHAPLLSGTPSEKPVFNTQYPMLPPPRLPVPGKQVCVGRLPPPSQLPHTAALFQLLLHNTWAQAWTSLGRILDNRPVTKRL